MTGHGQDAELGRQLARWVAAGLIDAGQAARIEAAEAGAVLATAQRRPGPAPPVSAIAPDAPTVLGSGSAPRTPAGAGPGFAPGIAAGSGAGSGAAILTGAALAATARRTPLVAEALGYLGAVLAIVAGFIALSLIWPTVPLSAEIAFAAVAAVALLAGGAAVKPGTEPALQRLRSVLWALSVISVTALAGIISGRELEMSAVTGGLATALAGTVYAVALWLRLTATLQVIAVFAGLAFTVGFTIAAADPHVHAWQAGLAVWLLAAGWGSAAQAGYLRPQTASFVCGAIGLLGGAQLMTGPAAGLALALLTVAGLLAAGVGLRRVLLVGIGGVGVIEFVPQAASRYLPHSLAGPLAVLLVGLILLGLAIWLAHWRRAPAT